MEQQLLLDKILSNENLNSAYKHVIRNKGAAGVDGMECAELFSHLKMNGAQIRENIRKQSYKPMPVKRVEIPKEDGSKRKLGVVLQIKRYFKLQIKTYFFNVGLA